MNLYGIGNYKSPYGSAHLQEQNEINYKQMQDTANDKYDFSKKYKKRQGINILLTIGLIAGGIFAGYKGKNKIGKLLNTAKNCFIKEKGNFAAKYPNFAEGCKGFKNAGKTLLKPFKNLIETVTNFFIKK